MGIGFKYDTALAFGLRSAKDSYDEFLDLTLHELSGGSFFAPMLSPNPLRYEGENAVFQSDIETEHKDNNSFNCVITDSGSRSHALVVFHHLFAQKRYSAFAKLFAARGVTVVEATLPYHFERAQSAGASAEMACSANIGLTVHSTRQAVLDGRKVVRWLKTQGYETVSVAGMCLGGLVAGLVAAHEEHVDKAVLSVTAGSPADVVWSDETMKPLRERIEPQLSLEELRRAWGVINLENHLHGFGRIGLDTMLVLGRTDTIVREEVSERFLKKLQAFDVHPEVLRLNCGNSSIGRFPYNLMAAKAVMNFIHERPPVGQRITQLRDRWLGDNWAVTSI